MPRHILQPFWPLLYKESEEMTLLDFSSIHFWLLARSRIYSEFECEENKNELKFQNLKEI